MRSITREHWLTIGAAILLIVLLLFVPILPGAKKTTSATPGAVNIDEIAKAGRTRLKPAAAQRFAAFERQITDTRDPKLRDQLYDSAASVAWRNGEVILASWMLEQRAKANGNTAYDWKMAGERYQASANYVQPVLQRSVITEAIFCLEKAVQLDPKDLDSKIDLGVSYVQDGRDPMKGVGLLKSVEAADSNNVNVQMALGEFSIQSGQLDKAIERFEKALRIKPEYYDLWTRMADVYAMQGKKDKEIECLKKYISLEQDPELRHEFEAKIAQLTKTN